MIFEISDFSRSERSGCDTFQTGVQKLQSVHCNKQLQHTDQSEIAVTLGYTMHNTQQLVTLMIIGTRFCVTFITVVYVATLSFGLYKRRFINK
jgi:hypothetical protein